MSPTLQLTPAAAARIYQGPRFHRRRAPRQIVKLFRERVKDVTYDSDVLQIYLGTVIEQIAKLKRVFP